MALQLALNIGKDLAAAVEERLSSKLSGYAREKPRVRVSSKSRKWAMSSAWQKSIRRGDVETACKMVCGLIQVDPDYVWRRMPVVAYEDVGAADLQLLQEVVWVCGKTKWRMNNDNVKVAMLMTEQLAAAAKDRVACDLEVWTDLDPELDWVRTAYAKLSMDELQSIAADRDQALAHRHIAMRYVGGTNYFPTQNFKPRDGDFKRVQEVVRAMGMPEDEVALITWSRNKAGSMCMALPYALESLWSTQTPTQIPDDIIDLPKIGPYPSCTFDLHNHQGKRAIAYFAKACKPMRSWLLEHGVPEDKVADTIVELLFRAETELLDRRLTYGITNETRYGSWAANVCYWSPLAREWVVPAVDMLRAHLEDLHHARVKVCLK